MQPWGSQGNKIVPSFKQLITASLLQKSLGVNQVDAGYKVFQQFLDPGFRRGDGISEFRKSLQSNNNPKNHESRQLSKR
jgi:hypothetical protein